MNKALQAIWRKFYFSRENNSAMKVYRFMTVEIDSYCARLFWISKAFVYLY